jgi:hypothetical protein
MVDGFGHLEQSVEKQILKGTGGLSRRSGLFLKKCDAGWLEVKGNGFFMLK